MKLKKIFFIIFVILFSLILFSNKSFAGEQKWKKLDYDVVLNEDGSMNVTETWNIYISETNTLFKDWSIDSEEYSSITDVSVTQIEPEKKSLEEIDEVQYHVDPGCFYALNTDSETFEIAWNVGLDNSSDTRTYQIKYKVNDVIKVYDDCTELYWQFLNKDNTIPANMVTGTVKLPSKVSNIEKLRVWGHGPLDANIERASEDTVKFDCKNFGAKTMLEIRVVTEENIYKECSKIINKNKLDSILKEEQEWADKANAQRRNAKIFLGLVYFIAGAIVLFLGKKTINYIGEGKELEIKYKRILPDLKYFRDIPNEKFATPARAAYLYYFQTEESSIKNEMAKIFSATMLDLALKKYIELEPIDKNNFNIIIKNKEKANLSSDEAVFLEILIKAAKDKDVVSTKELLSYTKRSYESMHIKLDFIAEQAKTFHITDKNFDSERQAVHKKWKDLAKSYITAIVLIFIGLFFVIPFVMEFNANIGAAILMITPVVFLGLFINNIVCNKNAKKVSVFSDKGAEEQLEWKALKNYMLEFSLLKDKEVPDLILWEKFLVYATVFGISKEVLKQLKTVYPQMSDPNYYNNRGYSYMYYMSDSRFGDNFVNSFNNAMSGAIRASQNAYNTAHSSYSSGSGGGGGFSGGGGGRRWPEVALEVVRLFY